MVHTGVIDVSRVGDKKMNIIEMIKNILDNAAIDDKIKIYNIHEYIHLYEETEE